MGVMEILLEREEKLRFEIGFKKGEAKQSRIVVENLILKLALSDEHIADVIEVSIDFVQKVRQEIASRK